MPTLPYAMPTNATSLVGVFQYVNVITDDLFGVMIVFGVWVMVFFALTHEPPRKSLTAASFISTLLAVVLWAAGISGATPVIATILALLASVGYMLFSEPGR